MKNQDIEPIALGAFSIPEGVELGSYVFGQTGKLMAECTGKFIAEYKAAMIASGNSIPQEISFEFGLNLNTEGNILKVFKAGGDAQMKMKITWTNLSTA